MCSVPEMGGSIAPPTSSSSRLVVKVFSANKGDVCVCELPYHATTCMYKLGVKKAYLVVACRGVFAPAGDVEDGGS